MEIQLEKPKKKKATKKKEYNCDVCKLDNNRVSNIGVKSTAEVLIVTEPPTNVELKYNKAIAGRAFRLLKNSLARTGFELTKCYFTSIILCGLPSRAEPSLPQIKSCGTNVVKLIEEMPNLKLIITCGQWPLKFFLNKSSPRTVRGELFRKNDYKIFPVYNPYYILDNTHERPVFEKDLKRAYSIVDGTAKTKKIKYTLAETLDDLYEIKEKVLAAKRITYDVESRGGEYGLDLYSKHNLLTTIAFTTDSKENFCIPIDHPESKLLGHRKEVIEVIRSIMTSPIKKVAHNCLYKETKVIMGDGTKRTIGDIVEKEINDPVLSYNTQTNKVESKPILSYFKSIDNDVRWMQIITDSSISSVHGSQAPRLTNDHKVYIKDKGYVRVDNVTTNDYMLINKPSPNSVQEQIIIGSSLGDGSIVLQKTAKAKNPHFKVGHSDKQKDYLQWKHNILNNLGSHLSVRANNRGLNTREGSLLYTTCTKSLSSLRPTYDLFYGEGTKKEVSIELLNKLTPLGLAVLYMDDGSKYRNDVYLHVMGFSDHSIDNIITYFRETYAINFKKKIENGLTRLRVGKKDGGYKFINMIAPYILPSLAYKIPEYFVSSYGEALGNIDNTPLDTTYTKVLNVIDAPLPVTKRKRFTRYCIEVADNNNFFTTGGLVSNCKFDTQALKLLINVDVNNVYFDTQLASSVLNKGNGNSNKLKRLSIDYLGYTENYSIIKDGDELDKKPLKEVAYYNAEDTENTNLLYEIFIARLKEENLYKFFMNVVMKGCEGLTDVEMNGIKIDTEYGAKISDKYHTLAEDTRNKLLSYPEVAEFDDFNMDSPLQLAALLFDKFKLPVIKKTKTGRSTDVDTLKALEDKHPFIKELQAYKKYEKTVSTYVKNITEKHLKDDGKIHCSFNQDVARTGRLCIRKGTLIETVRDVAKYPKGVPIEQVKKDDYVYCYDDKKNLTIQPVLWSGKTGHKKMVRLHWKGTGNKHTGYVDVTPTHPIRLVSGEYCRAEDLVVGMRTLALSRGKTNYGYSRLYATGIGEIPKDHRFVMEQLGSNIDGMHVHHINGNKLDNRPTNLQVMSPEDHTSYESKKGMTPERKENISKTLKKKYANGEIKVNYRRGEDSPGWLGLSKEWMENILWKHGGKPTVFRDIYGIDYETVQKYMELNGVDYKAIAKYFNKKGQKLTKEFIDAARSIYEEKGPRESQKYIGLGYAKFKSIQETYEYIPYNHIITAIEYLEETDDVYDLEVEEHHNFIANEICVHNSSSRPNMQNQQSRGEIGKDMKKLFIPSYKDGYIIQADYSQIELRIAALVAEEKTMIDIYAKDGDIHTTMAAFLTDKEPEDVTDDERSAAKPVNFGFLYGQLPKGFVKSAKRDYGVDFTLDRATYIRNRYFKMYSCLNGWYERTWTFARKHGYVLTLFGRKRTIFNLHAENNYLRHSAENQSINTPVQGTAGEMCILAIYYVNKILKSKNVRARIVNTVHDSIILECHKDELMTTVRIVKTVMENIPTTFDLKVPIKADIEYGPSWGELKELKL